MKSEERKEFEVVASTILEAHASTPQPDHFTSVKELFDFCLAHDACLSLVVDAINLADDGGDKLWKVANLMVQHGNDAYDYRLLTNACDFIVCGEVSSQVVLEPDFDGLHVQTAARWIMAHFFNPHSYESNTPPPANLTTSSAINDRYKEALAYIRGSSWESRSRTEDSTTTLQSIYM